MVKKVHKSEEDWREQLSPEQYRIMRQKGTERAFSGAYYNEKTPGVYLCAGCGAELFQSKSKYDSGSGWPSFQAPASDDQIATEEDRSYGMRRTEVMCASCDAHLGHVFPDGPGPNGLRYCINSACLELKPDSEDR